MWNHDITNVFTRNEIADLFGVPRNYVGEDDVIVDLSRAQRMEVTHRREVIDTTPLGETYRQYRALDTGPRTAEMIVDLGGMVPSLENAGVLARDLQMEFSAYDHAKVMIEGYLIPAREGYMYDDSRCHLCHAPLVNKRTETQVRYRDKKGKQGWDAEREEKHVLIQTYECGTEVIRDTQKRADEVTVGSKCIKLKEAK